MLKRCHPRAVPLNTEGTSVFHTPGRHDGPLTRGRKKRNGDPRSQGLTRIRGARNPGFLRSPRLLMGIAAQRHFACPIPRNCRYSATYGPETLISLQKPPIFRLSTVAEGVAVADSFPLPPQTNPAGSGSYPLPSPLALPAPTKNPSRFGPFFVWVAGSGKNRHREVIVRMRSTTTCCQRSLAQAVSLRS